MAAKALWGVFRLCTLALRLCLFEISNALDIFVPPTRIVPPLMLQGSEELRLRVVGRHVHG